MDQMIERQKVAQNAESLAVSAVLYSYTNIQSGIYCDSQPPLIDIN